MCIRDRDCTVQLIPQLQQAAVRAGIPVDAVATCKTEYAGHAKALARAAAEEDVYKRQRPTSCPDQIAKNLKKALAEM